MTPAELSFDVSEIGVAEAVEKTTAKITAKDNRQITSIEVANVVRNGESGKNNSLFTVDDEGVISPVDVEGFPDGKFVISLKVVIDEEEGLVANCLTVNVSARPVALEYSEALAGWQLAAGEDPKTFTSVEPVLSGSADGVEYAINQINAEDGIEPEEGMLTIDPGTGVVTLTTSENTAHGDYSVTFKVKNVWVEDFVEVEGVLDVQVTEPAHSIDNFSYDPANRVVSNETSDKTFPVSEMDGERVAFSLVSDEVPASLADKLEVDPDDGTITLKGGASGLKPGLYAVPVYAVNNTTPEGKTALFYLTVCEQDKFTFFSYGNNFETVKEQIAAGTTSQFRYDGNVTATTLPVLFSDFPENSEITWRAEAKNSQVKELSIDNSGNLSFTTACVSAEQVAAIFVTAKVGNTSITQPVFVNVPIPTIGGDYVVKYTPFVIRCKPNVEGTVYSSVPDIAPKPDVVDYRATTYALWIDQNYVPINQE